MTTPYNHRNLLAAFAALAAALLLAAETASACQAGPTCTATCPPALPCCRLGAGDVVSAPVQASLALEAIPSPPTPAADRRDDCTCSAERPSAPAQRPDRPAPTGRTDLGTFERVESRPSPGFLRPVASSAHGSLPPLYLLTSRLLI
jgi:hypothetical protein